MSGFDTNQYFADLDAQKAQMWSDSGLNDKLSASKKSKIDRLAPSDANILNAKQLQFQVNDIREKNEVFRRDDGSMYQKKSGIFGIESEVDYTGETTDLYIDNTDSGNMKLGLARLGFERRYTPGEDGYGWAPGAEGVNVSDGALSTVTLPREQAERLEFLVHSNKGQIENRVGGNTIADYKKQRLASKLGGGASEYTTPNAPMWNLDYQSSDTPLGDDTFMPAIPKYLSDEQKLAEIDKIFNSNLSVGDRMLNTAKGAASMFAGSAYDVADAVSEGVFSYDLGTDEEKTKQVDNLFGYNRSFTTETAQRVKSKIEDMNKTEWTASGVFDIILDGVTTPEFAGESFGYMLSLMVGGPAGLASKAALAAKGVKVAQKAGDTKKAATLAKQALEYKKLAKENGVIGNAIDKLMENAGLVAVSAGTTNDDIDKYAEMAGIDTDDVGAGKILSAFGGNILINSLNRTVDKSLFFNKTVKDGLVQAVGGAAKKDLSKIGKGLAGVTAALASGSGTEAATEYMQTFIEQVNQQFGKETAMSIRDVWVSEDNSLERATGGMLGASGAAQMQLAGSVMPDISSIKSLASLRPNLSDKKDDNIESNTEDELAAINVDYENMSDEDIDMRFETVRQSFNTKKDYNPLEVLEETRELKLVIEAKINREEAKEAQRKTEPKNSDTIKTADDEIEITHKDDIEELEIDMQQKRDAAIYDMIRIGEDAESSGIDSEEFKSFKQSIERIDIDDRMEIARVSAINSASHMRREDADNPGIDLMMDDNLDVDSYTEKTIEDTINTSSEQATQGENSVNEDGVNLNIEDETVVSETSRTDTHTQGFSAGTINKLAELFAVNPLELQSTLNSALPDFALRDMKSVSKEANTVQYEIYHGKNGIINNFAGYRSALSKGNKERAVELIKKIQRRGYTQERKLNRYAVKYDELFSRIEEVRDLVLNSENDSIESNKIIVSSIRSLNKGNFKPAYSKKNISAIDVAKDVDLPLAVKEELGIVDKESDVLQIMRSMHESIVHIDRLLASVNHTREYDDSIVVDDASDKATYEANIKKVEAKLEKLQSKEDLNAYEELAVDDLKDSIVRNIAGIDRIKSKKSRDSKKRVVSVDKTINKKQLNNQLNELKAIKDPTEEQTEQVSKIKKQLTELDEDIATIDSVNSQIGKELGKGIKKEKTKNRKIKTKSRIIGNIAKKQEDSKMTTQNQGVKVEEKDVDFIPKSSTSSLQNDLKLLSKNKERKKTINIRINKLLKKYKDNINEKRSSLNSFVDGAVAKSLEQADDAIRKNINAVESLKSEISKLSDKKKEIARKLDKTISNRVKKIQESDTSITNAREEMISGLEEVEKQLVKDGKIDAEKSIVSKHSKDIVKGMTKLAGMLKSLQSVVYRFIQSNDNSEISKSIKSLEKKLKFAEKEIVKNRDIKKDLYESIKDNFIKEDSADPSIDTGSKAASKAMSIIMQINKMKNNISGSKKLRRTKLEELSTKINELRNKLFSSVMIDEAINNGLESKKKSRKGKSGYEQLLNIREIITTSPTIIGSAKVEDIAELMDSKTKNIFLEHFNEAKSVIKKSIKLKTTSFKGKTNIDSEMQLFDSPFSGILFDKDGNVNDTVAMGIQMTGDEWLATSAGQNLYNSKSDISRMLGYISDSQVSGEEIKLLKEAGSFRKVVAHSLGNNLLSTLGIKIDKQNTPREIVDKIIGDAGMIVIAYMNESGMIQNINDSRISSSDWNSVFSENKELNVKTNVPMIVSLEPMLERYSDLNIFIKSIQSSLEIEPNTKDYKTYSPYNKDKDYSKSRGSLWEIPEKSQETLKTLEKEEYKVVDDAMDEFVNMFSGEDGRALYLDKVGYKDTLKMEKSNKYLFDEIESQAGLNRELEKEYDELIALYSRIKSEEINNKIFFSWMFTENGRFNIDSAGVNPQSSTIHRWLVLPSASTENEWDINSDEFMYFKFGLAQGLGTSIDKISTEEIIRIADDILNTDINVIIDRVKNNDDADHLGHAMQSIASLKKYKEAIDSGKSKFTSTMVSEYDSITSGFANKLMQAPVLGENLENYMEKTGVFTYDVDSEVGINDMIHNGDIIDSYKTLVLGISESNDINIIYNKDGEIDNIKTQALQSMTEDWKLKDAAIPPLLDDNGEVTSFSRNMMKYPFMIFGYGASINSIRNNLSNDLSINIMSGILNDAYDMDSNIMNYLGINKENIEQVKGELRTKGIDRVFIKNRSIFKQVSNLINETYGRETELFMNRDFGELAAINESIIDSTKVMFNGFINRLKSESDKLESKLGRPLSQNEVDSIILNLEKLFPLIKGPNSALRENGMSIIDTKIMNTNASYVDKGSLLIKNNNDDNYVSQSVQYMIREFDEAHAKGAVLPMHWIDGTIISELISNGGILGIHDAVVLGNNFKESIISLNKAAYDVNKNYNLVNEFLVSLEETMDNLSDAEIEQIKIKTFHEGESIDLTAHDILIDMKDTDAKVSEARDELYGEDGTNRIRVSNFGGPSSTEYIGGAELKTTSTKTEPEMQVAKETLAGKKERIAEMKKIKNKYTDLIFGKLSSVKGSGIKKESPLLGLWAAMFDGNENAIHSLGFVLDDKITVLDIKASRRILDSTTDMPKLISVVKNAKISGLKSNLKRISKHYDISIGINKKDRTEYNNNIIEAFNNIEDGIKAVKAFDGKDLKKEDILSGLSKLSNEMESRSTVLHEAGHVLTKSFIHNNPNNASVKKLKRLYDLALKYDSKEPEESGIGNNWKLDIFEFSTEIITNPKLVRYLNSAKGNRSSLSQLGSDILILMQSILRLAFNDANITLDPKNISYQAISEVSKMIDTQQDIVNKEVDKKTQAIQNNILQKKLKEMMENCKI